MLSSKIEQLLRGRDLRSLGKSEHVISSVKGQSDFDNLFSFLFHKDRLVVMRAADAIEKITLNHPEYLLSHKKHLLDLLPTATNKELKWHLALMLPRMPLSSKEFMETWITFTNWAKQKSDSKLVRVAAIQGLYELTKKKPELLAEFNLLSQEVERDNIPSVNARLRNIRKELNKSKAK